MHGTPKRIGTAWRATHGVRTSTKYKGSLQARVRLCQRISTVGHWVGSNRRGDFYVLRGYALIGQAQAAQPNRKLAGPLDTSAFIGTNPTGELITSGLPVIFPQWATANRERQGALTESRTTIAGDPFYREWLWGAGQGCSSGVDLAASCLAHVSRDYVCASLNQAIADHSPQNSFGLYFRRLCPYRKARS